MCSIFDLHLMKIINNIEADTVNTKNYILILFIRETYREFTCNC